MDRRSDQLFPFWQVAVFFVFILATWLRVYCLSMDAPADLSWSAGPFTDGANFLSSARTKIFWDRWSLYPLPTYLDGILFPVQVWFTYVFYRIFGIGWFQINMVSVIFGLLTIGLLFKMMSRDNRNAGLLSCLFLGTNYIFIMYNRLPMAETMLIFFLVATLYFWQRGLERLGFFYFSGLSLAIAIFWVKPTAFFFLAVIILLFFVSMKIYFSKKTGYSFLIFFGGLFTGFITWFLVLFIPGREVFLKYLGTGLYSMSSITSFSSRVPIFLSLGIRSKLFSRMPVISLLAYSYILVLFFDIRGKRVSLTDLMSLLWLLCGGVFLSLVVSRPLRYQIVIIPPLCILASLFLIRLNTHLLQENIRFPGKGFFVLLFFWLTYLFYHLIHTFERTFLWSTILSLTIVSLLYIIIKHGGAIKIPSLHIRRVSTVLLIVASLFVNGHQYFTSVKEPKYTLHQISEGILDNLKKDDLLAGCYASAACLDNNIRVIPSAFLKSATSRDFFDIYPVTHLLISAKEREFLQHAFPNIINNAVLLQTYNVGDNCLQLYKIAVSIEGC